MAKARNYYSIEHHLGGTARRSVGRTGGMDTCVAWFHRASACPRVCAKKLSDQSTRHPYDGSAARPEESPQAPSSVWPG